MTRNWLTIALPAVVVAAILAPPAQARDPRLVERLYNPNEVVRVDGRPSVQATIRFDEDEHIENVAIGDSSKWQVTPNKRAYLLFVKPLSVRAATNMTVITDRRTYLFDLVASPLVHDPLYVLSFTYPREAKAQAKLAAATPAAAPTSVEVAAASDPYAVVDPSKLNFAWRQKGEPKLLPTRVFDDGEATFLSWPVGVTLPAILIKDAKGGEGPVNYATRGDVIVVDGVPGEIVLRSGAQVADLVNEGPPRVAKPAPRQPPALAQATQVETAR